MQDCRERAVSRLSGGKVERPAMPVRVPVPVVDRSGPWVPRLIETLCEFKRLELDFEFAWRIALRQHPPNVNEIGGRFDPHSLEAYRGVCRNAWFDSPANDGTPSKLRGLLEALEGGLLPYEDQSGRVRTRSRRATV